MDSFHKPSSLSFDGNTSENWRRFKQQFDIYLVASGSEDKDDLIKIAILLNFTGEDAIEVFNTFEFAESDDKKLDKVIEQFEEYCNPRKNVVFERYQFWKTTQKDLETVDQFVTRLKNKIKSCECMAVYDMVRDKLVFSMQDLAVKERQLREDKLTPEKAVRIARAAEASKEQIKVMTCEGQSKFNQAVNVVKYGSNTRKNQSSKRQVRAENKSGACGFCGAVHAARSCPAFGKTCNYCKKIGHVEHMCRAKQSDLVRKEVNVVGESEDDDASNEDLLTFMVKLTNDGISKEDWSVELKIANTNLNFKLDSGADCNVMSQVLFNRLSVANANIRKVKGKLKMFDGRKISQKGKVSLECEYKGKFTVLDFVLVEQDLTSILGLKYCLELGLIKRIYSLEVDVPKVEKECGNVFEGLGEIKDVQYQIKVDPNASPVVHPPCRVPVALRKPLRDELLRMEKLGVIEKMKESTAWVHSLVIARKANNKIQVYMDPSDLNQVVMQEHFPMQTVEEVVSRMPKAKVFNVLDANHGIWQVKLANESSKLATFNTPFGRYSYKRLPFGIASAPEVFQSIMSNIFQDIDGVEIIVDDLVVWGEDVIQHDQRLCLVLECCREQNVKLNPEKCRFRVLEVNYVGHVLSSEGLKPDPKKIKVIEELSRPANCEDLKRFLGMVTYVSKFIYKYGTDNCAIMAVVGEGCGMVLGSGTRRSVYSFENSNHVSTSPQIL